MAIPHNDAVESRDGNNAQASDKPFPSEPSSRFAISQLLSSAAVTHAVRGRFRNPDVEDVVLGKRDALVLLVPGDHGKDGTLRLEKTQSTRGTLIELKVISPKTTTTGESHRGVDHLLALSDSGVLSLIKYDVDVYRFVCVNSVPLGKPGLRRATADASPSPVSQFHSIAIDQNSRKILTFCESRACLFRVSRAWGNSGHASIQNTNATEQSLESFGVLVVPRRCVIMSAGFGYGYRKSKTKSALALLVREKSTQLTAAHNQMISDALDDVTMRMETDSTRLRDERDTSIPVTDDETEYDADATVNGTHTRNETDDTELAEAQDTFVRFVDARTARRNRRNIGRDPGTGGDGARITDLPEFPRTKVDEASTSALSTQSPTRLDIFLDTPYIDSYTPSHSVVFDAKTKAVLGSNACFAAHPETQKMRKSDDDATNGDRFLLLGEFGAVEVFVPPVGDTVVRVVARATLKPWVPKCHVWQPPPPGTDGRWTLAVAVEQNTNNNCESSVPPDVRAVLTIHRETGEAVDVSGERKPRVRVARNLDSTKNTSTAIVAVHNGCAVIIFDMDGSAVVRSMDLEPGKGTRRPASDQTRIKYAHDAVDLVSTNPLAGDAPSRAPALANVDGFARFDGRDARKLCFGNTMSQESSPNPRESFLLTANGVPTRVTRGIAACVTTVSPAGFGDVVQMWAPDSKTLVLGFSNATRVFKVTRNSRSTTSADALSSFQESLNNYGFQGEECTTLCGVFSVGRMEKTKTALMQITPRSARVCRDGKVVAEWRPGDSDGRIGCAAIAQHGRAAVSLPKRGCVMLLAPMTLGPQKHATTLLPISIIKFTVEPSCLTLPDRATASAFIANAKEDAITASDVVSGSVSVVIAGTYKRDVIAVAARETQGSVATRASEVFRAECLLGVNDAPCALRVVSFRDKRKPTLLVVTRGGDFLVVEPSKDRHGASKKRNDKDVLSESSVSQIDQTELKVSPKRPPRLTGFGGKGIGTSHTGVSSFFCDPPVIRVGVDSLTTASAVSAQTQLSKMFEPPMTETKDVDMKSLDDDSVADVSDFEKFSVSLFRVGSRIKLGDAPLDMTPIGSDLASPVLLTSAFGSWLAKLVDGAQRVSVEAVSAPAIKSLCSLHGEEFLDSSTRNRKASCLATIGDRLRVVDVDTTQQERAHRLSEGTFGASSSGIAKVRFVTNLQNGNGVAVASTDSKGNGGGLDVTAWSLEEEIDGSDNEIMVDDDLADTRADTVTDTAVDPEKPSPSVSSDQGFKAVALASCLAEDGSMVLAIGTRGVPEKSLRRLFDGAGDTARVEGRVLFLRAVGEEKQFALAATVAFPDAVTCVSPGPAGLVLVGTDAGVHVLRVETRFEDAKNSGWTGDGDAVKTVSGTLRVWLAARLATRRAVLAIAAGKAEYPTSSGPGTVSDVLPVPETDRSEPSSERAMVEAMLFPGARAVETRKVVPVVVSVARDGVSFCAYIAGGGFFENDQHRRLAPKAADPITRDAYAVALRQRGEIIGADTQGRVFVLRRLGFHARTPERNLMLVASFGIKGATPVAVISASDGETEETQVDNNAGRSLVDRASLFKSSTDTRGPSFSVATKEGGVYEVFEVSESDYTVLLCAQRRMETHPLTASPLGELTAGVACGVARDQRYSALDAFYVSSATEPPTVLDGTVLRELLELPEQVQREILTCAMPSQPPLQVDALEIARRAFELGC